MIITLTAIRFDAAIFTEKFEIIGGGRRTIDLGSVDDHAHNNIVRTLRRWNAQAEGERYGNMPNRIVRIFVNRESTETSRWDEFASVEDAVAWLEGNDELALNSRHMSMAEVLPW